MNPLRRLHLDPFLVMILLMVLAATIVPAQGIGKTFFKHLTTAAIALLFFMHGAKLSREAVLAGVGHWRLHLLVLSTTFVLFPLLGRNVAAAICSAATSSLLGVFLSPLLVGLLLSAQGQTDLASSIRAVMLQLLLPFILGHLSRPLTAAWVAKNRRLIRITDQSSILLVVYTAFSEAVLEGIWSSVSLGTLVIIGVVSLALLAVVLAFTTYSARALGFNKADEITIVFCGSKKSLANGIPMANILFPPASVGILVLPLMLFHQIQLMLCAVLAQRYAKRPQED